VSPRVELCLSKRATAQGPVVTNACQLAKQKQAEERAKQKEADAARKKMEAQLFKPAQIQKVPFGTGELLRWRNERYDSEQTC